MKIECANINRFIEVVVQLRNQDIDFDSHVSDLGIYVICITPIEEIEHLRLVR